MLQYIQIKYLHPIKCSLYETFPKIAVQIDQNLKSRGKVLQYTFMAHTQILLYMSVTSLFMSITNLKSALSAILLNIIIALHTKIYILETNHIDTGIYIIV